MTDAHEQAVMRTLRASGVEDQPAMDFMLVMIEAVGKINSAVRQEEREECARIAETYLLPGGTPEGIDIARLIRERK